MALAWNMDVNACLVTKIRKLRHEQRFSQEELADRADLHRTYIIHIENGKREISVETLCKIARGFDILPSELMNGIAL